MRELRALWVRHWKRHEPFGMADLIPPAMIPSIGDAIDALSYIHDSLSQTLKQFLDFSAELASKDHAIENIPEVVDCSS